MTMPLEPRSDMSFRSDKPNTIYYAFGNSTLGTFLTAADNRGLCANLIGTDHNNLLDQLRHAFPSKLLALSAQPALLIAVGSDLIERPTMSRSVPTSTQGGDFEQMVAAALRSVTPGTTITPEGVTILIGAAKESATIVRSLAATDILAVATPFHRLEDLDGSSHSYRWGEACRQTLLKRERDAVAA